MSMNRPVAVGVLSLLALGAASTGASAGTSTIGVTASAATGSRQFFVEDLSGTALTTLDLGSSGQGQLFQTRVADRDFAMPQAAFTASAEMTHLYKTGTAVDYGTKVDSSKIAISYAQVPTDVAGVSLSALPKVRLTGLLPTCSELSTLLPSGSALKGTSLDSALALLGLSDAAAPLCTALGGALGTVPVSVDAVDGALVTLDEKVITPTLDVAAGLPVSLTGATEVGNFDSPSYVGVGAGDTGKPATPAAARARKVLAGSPNGGLDLNGLVSAAIDGLPLFPAVPGGTGALSTVSAVVSSTQSSSDAAVAAVGNALAGLPAADQTGVLSGLDPLTAGTPIASLIDTVLKKVSGTYRSFPRLTADLTGAPTGSYTGTMTITFVQQ